MLTYFGAWGARRGDGALRLRFGSARRAVPTTFPFRWALPRRLRDKPPIFPFAWVASPQRTYASGAPAALVDL